VNGSEREQVSGAQADAAVESANAGVLREGYALWNAGRLTEAMDRFWHPDAVVYHPPGWPEPGPSIGREAAQEQFERVREDFDVDRLEILELREIEGVLVLRMRWIVRGRGSGLDTSLDMSGVYWFDDGLIMRNAFYWDHEAALAAAVEA
jgi:ketosteroid isomerase-like protein